MIFMVQETEYLELFDGTTLEKDDVIDYLKSKYDQAYYNGLTKVTDFTEGSEAYHLLDTIASLFLEVREDINDNYLMSMIHTQEGEFLDNTGDSLGIYRKPASPSTGYVIIYYNSTALTADEILEQGEGTVCDLEDPVILEDLVVLTDDSISFTVEDADSNLNGNRYIRLEATCEYEGVYTNVLDDTITIIENDLPAGVRVTNTAFTGGTDIESDDDYRARILDHPNNSPTGSINWFKNIAFVDEGVVNLVHDIVPSKEGVSADEDLLLIYNPIDKDETPESYTGGQAGISGTYYPSEYALRQFFALDEYNIVGIALGYQKATPQYVLADTSITGYTINYEIYVNIDTAEYPEATLSTVTPKVEAVINQFNNDANINQDFNPANLCVLIEEIPEVTDAIIYQKATKTSDSSVTWGIVTEPISMDTDEVYQVSPDVGVINTGPATGLITTPSKSDNP